MKIPFLDLQGQHARIRDELDAAIREVVDSCTFIGGAGKRFESELARFMETRHACGVASGTAALSIVLESLHLQPGEEVVTTTHTAMPTAEAITLAGGRVVFADTEPGTYHIDPDHVASLLGERTRAILPVHLYGSCARIERLMEIAEQHALVVVEDVAQAQGARYRGRRAGSFGLAGCLSFFPSKNLGAFGDAGAVVTDDDATARFVAMYSNHGRLEKFNHEMEGANERLDGLQAAILRVKLAKLEEWNARRREVAAWYEEALAEVEEVTLPRPVEHCEPVWHLYVVQVRERDVLREALKADGIQTGLHYPLPLHLQPAYGYLGLGPGSLPVAEAATARILSLPMDPFMTREQVFHVAERIRFHLVRPGR